jgi:hypothetical protein
VAWRSSEVRGPVIAHRGAWVSVGSGFLDIPQRDPASSAAVMSARRSVRSCNAIRFAKGARGRAGTGLGRGNPRGLVARLENART